MSEPVNNGPPNRTNTGEGDNPTLDALYDTLGAVQAGIQTRQQETDEAKKQLLDQERALIQERDQAADDGDHDRADELSQQLDELREAWAVLTQDDEENAGGSGTHQHQDREGRPDARGSDSDPGPDGPGG